MSRYDNAPPRALVLYVPATPQNRRSFYEVELPLLPFLRSGSVANVQDLGSIPVARLERRLGQLPDEAILQIKQALMFDLDLSLEEP